MSPRSKRKERITVSLSRESAHFLRAFRAKTKAPSMSALIENLAFDLRSRAASDELNSQIRLFYDNLSPSGAQEDYAWGRLGEASLGLLTNEDEQRRKPKLQADAGRSGDK